MYRHILAPDRFQGYTATVSSPNGHLEATEPGLYEISSVMDAQCPGTINPEGAIYRVDWVPRPSARLSPSSEATYERHNRSHVLSPVCEGIDDHVDLELTGDLICPLRITLADFSLRTSSFPDYI